MDTTTMTKTEIAKHLRVRDAKASPNGYLNRTIYPRYGTGGKPFTIERNAYRKARLFMWVDGETIASHLLNRHFQDVKALRAALPMALEALGLDPALAKGARWSQRAGCSCPCSPGFILNHVSREDYFVTVEGIPMPAVNEALVAEAVMGGRAITEEVIAAAYVTGGPLPIEAAYEVLR